MQFRPSRMRVWLVLVLGMAGAAKAADAGNAGEGLSWLKKMAAASRQLNYSGTIVYQHRNHVETSRIVHYVNPAGGEFEKLETMDGPPREVVRSNDHVICYLPNVKTVLIEERNRSARNFPALVPESLGGITESYAIRKGEVDRVAGHDCQWILLEPRDEMRYGRRFCAELGSGLPLRAHTLNEKGEPLESFAFSQLTMGGSFSRDRVKSKYAEKSKAQNWRVERSGYTAAATTPSDSGWTVTGHLPGFRKLMEAKRSIGGRGASVSQIVLSDGLAAVSVFIEPMRETKGPSLSSQGAVNIYTRPLSNHIVTVLGEAPTATLMQIANSLEQKPTTASLR
ncbi:MAG TPA: MucB/RseB C-terminal domain-containing protein [Burkholderiales bacterium]|nr:MucB/RseB C-terminal domain-containing protein [Burkholderiales bacterium]